MPDTRPAQTNEIGSHYCMSENSQYALRDIEGALNAVAMMLDAPGADHDIPPTDMASLMRTLARATSSIVEASPFRSASKLMN